MKRKIFILILLVSSISFSQTPQERLEITQDYDMEQVQKLFDELNHKNLENKKAIDEYLQKFNINRKIKLDNGGVKAIRYIIDGKPIYISTDAINSIKATRTDFLHNGGSLGLNLEGQNMHIATWDGGPTLASHQEFLDNSVPIPMSRVNNADLSASNDRSDHSTHVSGIIMAKGTVPSAKGMAPQATLTSYDWDFDSQEALTQATTNGLLISNHSYGIPVDQGSGNTAPAWLMGCYSSEARTWDQVAYSAPYYLMVTSAGNDGQTTYTGGLATNYDKLTGFCNSKNNLVVANADNPLINPNGSGDLLNMFINPSSSQGPTDDRRIKPDITGDGTSVYSSIGTSSSAYATYSGTSMSAPNVSGSLLLLQQYYNQINSVYMRSSTLKGLICNTADDDTSILGPDPIFGWGLLNSKVAAETILKASNGQALILERTLNNGESFTYNFSYAGTSKISATICWTDPAGASKDGILNSTTPALVNDLDIRLTQGVNTYFPWKLDVNNVTGTAIKGDNTVDNVEKIEISNPSSGNYTLTVNHKGSLTTGSQQYAIILTGNDLTLGSEEYSLNDFNVWPNPASDRLNISFKSITDNFEINMYDLNGRSVYKESILNNSSKTYSINTNRFSTGIYILNINFGNRVFNKKIIIE